MINVAIIGAGHWGNNFVRIVSEHKNSNLKCIIEKNQDQLNKFKNFSTNLLNSHKKLSDYEINLAIVTTPASTHFKICKELLDQNIDILLEKPACLTKKEISFLFQLAKKKGKIIFVNHTYLFNSYIKFISEFINHKKIGKVLSIKSTRTHLGLIRKDVSAIWDLIPHDISIIDSIINKKPKYITGVAAKHISKQIDNAYIALKYDNNIISNIHVSWEESNKVRRIEILGTKARIVFDELNTLEPIKIYNKPIMEKSYTEGLYADFAEFQFKIRSGDIITPFIKFNEPLKSVYQECFKAVNNRKLPTVISNDRIIRIVEIIENIHKNIR